MIGQRVFSSPFAIGDRVYIDGDDSFAATVTALCFRNENPEAEVAWLANHESKTAWLPVWRLVPKEQPASVA